MGEEETRRRNSSRDIRMCGARVEGIGLERFRRAKGEESSFGRGGERLLNV